MTDELTRLTRNAVQAAVGAIVTFLAARGFDVDVDALMVVLFPIVLVIVTGVVEWVRTNVPVIGRIVGILNGPGSAPVYEEPVIDAA